MNDVEERVAKALDKLQERYPDLDFLGLEHDIAEAAIAAMGMPLPARMREARELQATINTLLRPGVAATPPPAR